MLMAHAKDSTLDKPPGVLKKLFSQRNATKKAQISFTVLMRLPQAHLEPINMDQLKIITIMCFGACEVKFLASNVIAT